MTQDSAPKAAQRRQRAGLKPVETPSVAASTVAELFGQGDNNTTTLRNGTVLRLKPVPPYILREVSNRIPEVPVPVVYIAEKDREEANPNDPDYEAAVEKRLIDIVHAMQDAMFTLGVEVVSVGDCPRPEDDAWVGQLAAVGIEADVSTPYHRQLNWLKYVCLTTENDIGTVVRNVIMLSGVTELEVFRAARNFRGNEERGTDRGGAAPATG